MQVERQVVNLTTDASGNVVGYTSVVTGRVLAVHYIKDANTPFADGVDFAVTAEATGESIWAENDVNSTAHRYPRAGTHSTAGVAALYAAGGTAVDDAIAVASDRVKISISSGGDTKHGAVHVVVG